MIKVNKNLALFLGLFIIISAILISLFQRFTPLISHITYYCQSFLDSQSIPLPYYITIIPFSILFVILMISVTKFIWLHIQVHLFKTKLTTQTIIEPYLQKLIKQLELEEKTIVIHSDKPTAFCLGIRKPKIYISTGLLAILSEKEIEVVLRHEQYHLENHDTFIMIVASVSSSMFPFFPLIEDLIKKYRVEREIQADKFAINKVGHPNILVSALKKLLISPTFKSVPLAAIADQDTLEPRIYSLLDKPYSQPRFKFKHVMITILSSFVLGAIVVSPVQATELHHDHYDIMALTSEKSSINTCATKEK